MQLDSLLYFIPLGVGIVWLFHLVFRADMASQPLGKIISYFLGVLIITLAVGWLIDNVFPNWVYTRLESTQTSTEWQQVIDSSSNIIDSSFSANGGQGVVAMPTPTQVPLIVVTPETGRDGADSGQAQVHTDNSSGPITHTVVEGDTLSSLARKYNVTVDQIMRANGLSSSYIYVGDQLVIPAASGQ